MASTGRKILIAMDGSKHAEYALRYFKDNVYREGDDVIVLYAVERGTRVIQPTFSADPKFLAHLAEEENTEVETVVGKLTALLAEVGVKGQVQRVSGNKPGEVVIKAATDLHVDMIVTGTRGLGTIRRTLLGSVSQYLVQHAHVPVLVCRHN